MAAADADAFARAAEGFIGTPFRIHGRDPASGLDCIGLVYASLTAIGRDPVAPRGYGLRNCTIAHWLRHAGWSGLALTDGAVLRGDVLLVQPSPVQHHLLIVSHPGEVVHAHAGLRHVVRQPLTPDARVALHWRLIPQS